MINVEKIKDRTKNTDKYKIILKTLEALGFDNGILEYDYLPKISEKTLLNTETWKITPITVNNWYAYAFRYTDNSGEIITGRQFYLRYNDYFKKTVKSCNSNIKFKHYLQSWNYRDIIHTLDWKDLNIIKIKELLWDKIKTIKLDNDNRWTSYFLSVLDSMPAL